ncbi:hypothetical protein PALB_32180 [Pseudoalteromonas luteoviolacea B = ATCC 29581]|nr:hypothetical protein PALB_32180 [Pseudoalteromonas luteoviolacea B = ATCC 29581]
MQRNVSSIQSVSFVLRQFNFAYIKHSPIKCAKLNKYSLSATLYVYVNLLLVCAEFTKIQK